MKLLLQVRPRSMFCRYMTNKEGFRASGKPEHGATALGVSQLELLRPRHCLIECQTVPAAQGQPDLPAHGERDPISYVPARV